MRPRVLLDTGPLVAFLNRRDQHHAWARTQLGTAFPPLLTCESVLAEACHLLRNMPGGMDGVLELLRRDAIAIPFRLREHADSIARLLRKYGDVPMSLADACLVRMSEIHEDSLILTLDSHFKLYRRHGRQVIPTLMPAT